MSAEKIVTIEKAIARRDTPLDGGWGYEHPNTETATMRFPAWREVSEPNRDKIPNTTVIGGTGITRLVTIPYAGTEPPIRTIVRPPLTDYVELPVDV